MQRNPKPGPTPSGESPTQKFPGVEGKMQPEPDHGERSYRGSGRLDGLKAIVTGGDSGIGKAVAIAFAREGADVAIGYEAEKEDADAEDAKRWVEKAGRRCLLHRFDVREPEQCRAFVDHVVQEFGGLDVLVNNAAYQHQVKDLRDLTPEQIDRTFRTNIYGYIFMAQAALRHMEAGACIVNTGSVTALEGSPALLDYSATKGAIHTFTKSLAHNLAEDGIRVNCVAPGPVWTPFIPGGGMSKDEVANFGRDTLWKRPAQPAELAPAFVYLASAESRYVTGEIAGVTGGTQTR